MTEPVAPPMVTGLVLRCRYHRRHPLRGRDGLDAKGGLTPVALPDCCRAVNRRDLDLGLEPEPAPESPDSPDTPDTLPPGRYDGPI
ncbi:hypothetical protein [Frankia sp. Cr2]|uniref:hypothetical protein n=1 Tax=Frankia sp. Cr2 TaxID=3073932 RepID=UPI002AD31196|nr:hypothetical protein [Frankia sp. Cr2]